MYLRVNEYYLIVQRIFVKIMLIVFKILLVKLEIDYKNQLFYENEIIIKTILNDTPAAKICFDYEICRKSDNELILTASTIQIFMNKKRESELNMPDFFQEWKNIYLK